MFCMAMSPDGQQVLVPVSPAHPEMNAWNSQNSMPNTECHRAEALQMSMPHGEDSAESLDAKAAALSAYAAQVKAEARRARAAAAVARRNRGQEVGSTMSSQPSESIADSCVDITEDLVAAPDEIAEIPDDDRTTLMFRNLPNNYSRAILLQMLDSEGFKGTYNLVYLPTDFRNVAGFGYAFVNFCTHERAQQAKVTFQGFSRWTVPSRKTCDVVWTNPEQGFDAHVQRFQNSPVMHESVPDEFKPVVFENGVRVPFPLPTKRIRAPRVRRSFAESAPQEAKRPHRKTM
jgi:hypothetical protein